ncbi:MAG: hypothetical protein QOH34_1587 [Mycobacterium sp.]|nr:hypothetical protein [Mycobacterium sp.]
MCRYISGGGARNLDRDPDDLKPIASADVIPVGAGDAQLVIVQAQAGNAERSTRNCASISTEVPERYGGTPGDLTPEVFGGEVKPAISEPDWHTATRDV